MRHTSEPGSDLARKWIRKGRVGEVDHSNVLIGDDGNGSHIRGPLAPIHDSKGEINGDVLGCRDVAQLQRMVRRLAHRASHDPLTGLLNRFEFGKHLDDAVERSRQEGRPWALCYMDLDYFKIVNDTWGHLAGDELLKQVAGLLRCSVRACDVLARLGGDEFGVLLSDCTLGKARVIANRLRRAIKKGEFTWENQRLDMTASIGLAAITPDKDAAEALHMVDSACYVAKELGRNRLHVYRPRDPVLAVRNEQLQWRQRIQRSLEDGHLCLYCQRAVALADPGSGTGYHEILLRMLGEDGQVTPAREFIPIAERFHLMPAVDRWVIRTAFSTVCRPTGESKIVHGINLSGQTLEDGDFAGFVMEQMERNGINARDICFEISDRFVAAHPRMAIRAIGALKELRCRVALDGFGSGMSPLGSLRHLSIDYLKIDGSFVSGITGDSFDHVLVHAIGQISHTMGIETIAEHVENDATRSKLIELGVDYAQGYGIERPKRACAPGLQLVSGTVSMGGG